MTRRARTGSIEGIQDQSSGGQSLTGWRRIASTLLGVALLVRGVRRRSPAGVAGALAGGWLLARGLSGRRRPERTLGGRVADRGPAGTADRRGAEATDRSPTGADRMASTVGTITVRKPPEELSELWRDPERLSQIVGDVAEVSPVENGRLRWTVQGPFGRQYSWESRIVEDRPGEVLRWEALDGAPIHHEGSVRFRPAPADLGTEVTLAVQFDPPGGAVGERVLSRLGVVPGTLVDRMLRRFRSLAETGEVPTLERNPSGRGSGDLV